MVINRTRGKVSRLLDGQAMRQCCCENTEYGCLSFGERLYCSERPGPSKTRLACTHALIWKDARWLTDGSHGWFNFGNPPAGPTWDFRIANTCSHNGPPSLNNPVYVNDTGRFSYPLDTPCWSVWPSSGLGRFREYECLDLINARDSYFEPILGYALNEPAAQMRWAVCIVVSVYKWFRWGPVGGERKQYLNTAWLDYQITAYPLSESEAEKYDNLTLPRFCP